MSPSWVKFDHSSVMLCSLHGKVSNLMGFVIRLTARAQAISCCEFMAMSRSKWLGPKVSKAIFLTFFLVNNWFLSVEFNIPLAMEYLQIVCGYGPTEMPHARLVKATMRQVTSQSLCQRRALVRCDWHSCDWHPVDSVWVDSHAVLWVLVQIANC